MMPKLEQTSRWASQEAAIKVEINEAKKTLDLMRMAHAIARLDALHAEMEAASNSDDGHRA
jgi:predicted transposase YbfD/YdcC